MRVVHPYLAALGDDGDSYVYASRDRGWLLAYASAWGDAASGYKIVDVGGKPVLKITFVGGASRSFEVQTSLVERGGDGSSRVVDSETGELAPNPAYYGPRGGSFFPQPNSPAPDPFALTPGRRGGDASKSDRWSPPPPPSPPGAAVDVPAAEADKDAKVEKESKALAELPSWAPRGFTNITDIIKWLVIVAGVGVGLYVVDYVTKE